MTENYEIDNLDKRILTALLSNAKVPYSDLATKFGVSSGTIHVRVEKMKGAGIITGSKIKVSYQELGFGVKCFIGINLISAKDCQGILAKLRKFEEVVEGYTTTGTYSLFIKVITRDISELNAFLISRIQTIKEIQSTETIIALSSPIKRDIIP